jgi:hypothetical protein
MIQNGVLSTASQSPPILFVMGFFLVLDIF